MVALVFGVQVAGAALLAGMCASAAWPIVARATANWGGRRRADALLVAGVAPMVISGCLALALLVPTALEFLGVRTDHCHAHAHVLHLCGVHGAAYPPLVALGVLLTPLVLARTASQARRLWLAAGDVRALEQVGLRQGRVVEVPGEIALCHATGVIRRRVLLSMGLRARLSPDVLAAALAHEHAHLDRNDPAALVLLQIAAGFGVPGLGLTSQFREAAEEAADAEAAADLGGLAVADALVRVARYCQNDAASPTALAFGDHPLERRVKLLLGEPAAPERRWGLQVAMAGATAVLLMSLVSAERIHHLVEDILLLSH